MAFLEIFKNYKMDKNIPARKVTKFYPTTYTFTHRIKFCIEAINSTIPAGFTVDASIKHPTFGILETKSYTTTVDITNGLFYFDIDFANPDLCKDVNLLFTFAPSVNDYYMTVITNFLDFNENREPFMVRKEL